MNESMLMANIGNPVIHVQLKTLLKNLFSSQGWEEPQKNESEYSGQGEILKDLKMMLPH